MAEDAHLQGEMSMPWLLNLMSMVARLRHQAPGLSQLYVAPSRAAPCVPLSYRGRERAVRFVLLYSCPVMGHPCELLGPPNFALRRGRRSTSTPISSHAYRTSLATGLNAAHKYRTCPQFRPFSAHKYRTWGPFRGQNSSHGYRTSVSI